MRLVTVRDKQTQQVHFGIELKDKVLSVEGAMTALDLPLKDYELCADALDYFANLPKSEKVLRGLLQRVAGAPRAELAKLKAARAILDRAELEYLPPIPRPGKFLCIGLNYKDHCAEQKLELPKAPLVFNKFGTSLRGHEQEIPLPLKVDSAVDFEAELGVVIGKTAKRVTKRSAMKHVAGYTIVNDVSARTLQKNEKQWARAKGFDGSAPYGPAIVTADEIAEPHNLKLSLKLNGTTMQSSNTAQLVFDIPALIAYVSAAITLEPGDIISTGTPGGVGQYRTPPVYLKPGDIVEVTIEKLGTLRNRCVEG